MERDRVRYEALQRELDAVIEQSYEDYLSNEGKHEQV